MAKDDNESSPDDNDMKKKKRLWPFKRIKKDNAVKNLMEAAKLIDEAKKEQANYNEIWKLNEDEISPSGDVTNEESSEEKDSASSPPKDDANSDQEREARRGFLAFGRKGEVDSPSKNKPKELKKRKRSGALSKTIRTLTLVIAILCYPIVADEVGDYITVGGSDSPSTKSTPDLPEKEKPAMNLAEDSQSVEKNDVEIVDKEGWKDKLPPPPKQRINQSKNTPSLNDRRRMALSFISEVVDEVGPAVVRIDTESVSKGRYSGYQNSNNPLNNYVQQGQGSGLIFSAEGFILTNAHVVEGATKVKGKQPGDEPAQIGFHNLFSESGECGLLYYFFVNPHLFLCS